jgi:hypothetical protein
VSIPLGKNAVTFRTMLWKKMITQLFVVYALSTACLSCAKAVVTLAASPANPLGILVEGGIGFNQFD